MASSSRISDWMRRVRRSRPARPSSSARRLTGVTRKRSITPERNSSIRPEPTPLAPKRPELDQPGRARDVVGGHPAENPGWLHQRT